MPRAAYRGTVQVSLRGGEVHLYIAPAPGFKWVQPDGQVIVDETGAVKQVRWSVQPHKPAVLRHRRPLHDEVFRLTPTK